MAESDFYEALTAWKENNSIETETCLYNALKALELYVPAETAGSRKRFVTAGKNGNEEYIPAFTSVSEYEKLPVDQREYVRCSFDLLRLTIMDDDRKIEGIAINPHGKVVLFPIEAIQRMDSVTSGMTLQKTRGLNGIYLDEPQRYPSGLVVAIRKFLYGKPQVNRVNLYKAKRNAADKAHWLFLVHFAGDKIDLFPELANVIKRYMKPGEVFELVQGSGDMIHMDAAKKNVIYERPS